MSKITRTITTTAIECASVTAENGTVVTEPLVTVIAVGKLDRKKAERKVRNEYGYHEGTIVVTGIRYDENKYEMELETFIANATKVTTENE